MRILRKKHSLINMIKAIILSAVIMLFVSFKSNNDYDPIYLDPSQPIENRINDLMGRMTLEDKV